MSDTLNVPATVQEAKEAVKVDYRNQIELRVTRPADGQTLHIFIRSPELADIVEKMTIGNAPKADFDKIYHPILLEHPNPEAKSKGRVVTRPAIARITKNFIGDPAFSWDHPRAILISNPEKLREGFTLEFKVDQPIPPETIRKWGKMLHDGCGDILSNARPFEMEWVTGEKG